MLLFLVLLIFSLLLESSCSFNLRLTARAAVSLLLALKRQFSGLITHTKRRLDTKKEMHGLSMTNVFNFKGEGCTYLYSLTACLLCTCVLYVFVRTCIHWQRVWQPLAVPQDGCSDHELWGTLVLTQHWPSVPPGTMVRLRSFKPRSLQKQTIGTIKYKTPISSKSMRMRAHVEISRR